MPVLLPSQMLAYLKKSIMLQRKIFTFSKICTLRFSFFKQVIRFFKQVSGNLVTMKTDYGISLLDNKSPRFHKFTCCGFGEVQNRIHYF